ncbi:MAG TPA: PAS domain S-box protein [Terriglobia bacterium]|nr:PAS domain S-box protein [Terriglobia bacterium]
MRKLAAETKAEKARLAKAVEQAADSVAAADATGNTRYVNLAFTRLIGCSAKEVIGKNPRLLMAGEWVENQ